MVASQDSSRPGAGVPSSEWSGGSVNQNLPSGPTTQSLGASTPSGTTVVNVPAAHRWIDGAAVSVDRDGMTVAPFWAMSTSPALPTAIPFGPPPVSTASSAPEPSRSTR